MIHVRLSQITADEAALGGCVSYAEDVARPMLAERPGSLGLSLLASQQGGGATLASFWASREALEGSEDTGELVRRELARRAGGPVAVEEYEVVIFEREALLHAGQAVRLTRVTVKPSAVDEVIEVVGDSAVPSLAEAPGFRGALLFADPGSGRLLSHTTWRDPAARAASPSVAAIIRANVLDPDGCHVSADEDYTLVFGSLRAI